MQCVFECSKLPLMKESKSAILVSLKKDVASNSIAKDKRSFSSDKGLN